MRPSLVCTLLLAHLLLACALAGARGPGYQRAAAWGVLASLVCFAVAVGDDSRGAP